VTFPTLEVDIVDYIERFIEFYRFVNELEPEPRNNEAELEADLKELVDYAHGRFPPAGPFGVKTYTFTISGDILER
jgi:hypothetical protein